MTAQEVLKACKHGDRMMDTMSGEELKYVKFDYEETGYVTLSDKKGGTVWLQPVRLELIKD